MREIREILKSFRLKVYNAKETHSEELFEGLELQATDQILSLLNEAIGEDKDEKEQDSLKKYFGDIRYDRGYNLAKAEIREKVDSNLSYVVDMPPKKEVQVRFNRITVEKAEASLKKNYPCEKCGKPRTKAQGGTTFTVCDECWDKDEQSKYCECKEPNEVFARDNDKRGYMMCNKCLKEIGESKQHNHQH